jgi:hypothetical protein
MHLPNVDHHIQLGGVSKMPVDMGTHNDGISKTQQNEPHTNGSDKVIVHSLDKNELRIPYPQDQDLDQLLDTILTAWTLLIQRYQRETFHQFTWGIRSDGNAGKSQCVSTTELDLLDHKAAESLRAKISNTRTSEFALNPDSTIFLNDGTSVEVRVLSPCVRTTTNCSSGLLR